MIYNKLDLKEYLERDCKALFPDGKNWFGKVKDPIYRFQYYLRKSEYYRNTRKKPYLCPRYLFWKALLRKCSIKLSFSIPENVFGPGLSIAHYGSIVVNPNARVGENCRIHVGVNIGAGKHADETPHIGNNVYIGPGAKLFGAIQIGDNTKIGANAVVNKSYNGGGTLVGVPAYEAKKEK